MTEKEFIRELFQKEVGIAELIPRLIPRRTVIQFMVESISYGRATAKVDREVLIRFLMWAWANRYMQHSYKSGLDAEDDAGIIADKFLSTLDNKGGGK